MVWSLAALACEAPREPEVLKLEGDIEGVHDPVTIKQKDSYYIFCTGGGRGGHPRVQIGNTGRPFIQISTLTRGNGWPRAGTLP